MRSQGDACHHATDRAWSSGVAAPVIATTCLDAGLSAVPAGRRRFASRAPAPAGAAGARRRPRRQSQPGRQPRPAAARAAAPAPRRRRRRRRRWPRRAAAAAARPAAATAPLVHVATDVLDLDISLKGGELAQRGPAPVPAEQGQAPAGAAASNRDERRQLYVLQTGLSGAGGGAAPTHLATLHDRRRRASGSRPAQRRAARAADLDRRQGLTVTKTFVLHARPVRDRSRVRRSQNDGTAALATSPPTRRSCATRSRCERSLLRRRDLFVQGPGRLRRHEVPDLKVDDADDAVLRDVTGGWIAAMQHHFVAADRAAAGCGLSSTSCRRRDTSILLSATGPDAAVAPGAARTVHGDAVRRSEAAGPARGDGPELDRATDYGRLTISRSRCSGCWTWCTASSATGAGRSSSSRADQAAVLSAEPGERPLDGEDARCSRASSRSRKPTRTTARSSAAR